MTVVWQTRSWIAAFFFETRIQHRLGPPIRMHRVARTMARPVDRSVPRSVTTPRPRNWSPTVRPVLAQLETRYASATAARTSTRTHESGLGSSSGLDVRRYRITAYAQRATV